MGFRDFKDLKISELQEFYVGFQKFFSSLMDVLKLGTLAGQIYIFLFLNRGVTFTTTQMAHRLGQDPSYVYRSLMRMETGGYIKRVEGKRHFWTLTNSQ